MTMSCGSARRILWPDGGPRAISPEIVDAQQHFAECAGCRQFASDMRVVSDGLSAAAPRVDAPLDVRNRLFKAIARLRSDRAGVGTRPAVFAGLMAVVATVFLAVAISLFVSHESSPASSMVAMLTEDHARSLHDTRIDSESPEEVTRWLADQLHFSVAVPVLPSARLHGARLCVADGRLGAVVEYKSGADLVSYFVIPDGSGSGVEGSTHFSYASRDGYHVVSWRERGYLHAMVGSIPERRLADLAHACINAMGRIASIGTAFIATHSRK